MASQDDTDLGSRALRDGLSITRSLPVRQTRSPISRPYQAALATESVKIR